MAKDSDKLDIYIKIFNYIENNNAREHYPKTTEILEYVNSFIDTPISERTINRYINDIAHIFDVLIDKKSRRSGYYIDTNNSNSLTDVYKTIELFEKAKFFKKLVENSSTVLKYFAFDSDAFKGINWIDEIISAITNKNIIKITHKRFDTQKQSTRKVEPYLIKEYANRWYLVGLDLSKNEYRTFGLDRIINIEILKTKFKSHKTEEIKEQFEHTIGLVYSKPEKVVLEFEKRQSEYFKANPWHKNYSIIEDNNEKTIIEMFVSTNYELEQKILMHHSYVKVIEPKHLAKQIMLLQKNALKQYE